MTLTVTLTLPAEVEAELRQSLQHHDTEKAHQILSAALTPLLEELLLQETSLPEEEWEGVAEQLISDLSTQLAPNIPPLSDHAVSRDGIYEDHP